MQGLLMLALLLATSLNFLTLETTAKPLNRQRRWKTGWGGYGASGDGKGNGQSNYGTGKGEGDGWQWTGYGKAGRGK
eukprot:Pgem_evm1s3368